MRFIHKHGFTTYMGRSFYPNKSTEITDRGTIAALLKHPDFMEVSDEQAKVEAPAPAPVLKRPTLTIPKLGQRR